jgi:ankyrin repeat protein
MDKKNEDEETPVHLAAIHGRVDVVEALLIQDRNAIMNEDEDSNTPLHLACMNRYTYIPFLPTSYFLCSVDCRRGLSMAFLPTFEALSH